MIPIYVDDIDSFDPSKYLFRINVKNNSDSILNVTTNDFKVYLLDDLDGEKEIDNGLFFKPDPITKEHIIITKLKPDQFGSSEGEEINLECTLSIGTGKENAGYSPVSKVVFFNSLDEKEIKSEIKRLIAKKQEENGDKLDKSEIQKIQRNFENFEAYRHFCKNEKGEPNKFNFEIESIGIMTVDEIMNKSLEIIDKNINYFNLAVSNENEDITIEESPTVMDGLDITVLNQGHTLGNLIQSYLFINYIDNSSEELKYVGYKVPHPLKKELVIRVQINQPDLNFDDKKQILKDVIQGNTEKINEIISNIKKGWNAYSTTLSKDESSSSVGSSSSLESSSSKSGKETKIIIKKKKKSSSD